MSEGVKYINPIEKAGVEIIGTCEGCECLLLEGDQGHTCSDGPTLCENCAPTYGDVKRQAQERLAEGDEDAREIVAACDGHVAAGGSLDDKSVLPL